MFGQQEWNNNHYLAQTNLNGGSVFNTWRWLFQSGASDVHTFGGDAVRFFQFNDTSSDPAIINQSSATHIINNNIEGDGDSGDPLSISIQSSGGLTFGGTVNNQGSPINVQSSGGSPGAVTFNGVMSGSGALNSSHTGTVVLAAANTYSGTTDVSNGIVLLANSAALGSTNAGTSIRSGASLQLSNGITVTGEALTLTGTGIGSGGALRSVSGSNSYTGPITANSALTSFGAATNATLVVGSVNSGSQEFWIVGDGTTIASSGATNSGSGTAFVKTNTGTAILAASNAWSGDEFIRQGTVVLSNNNALGAGGVTYLGALDGATAATANLQIGSGIVNSNAIVVEGGGNGVRTLSYAAGTGTGTQLGSITLNTNSLAFNIANGGTMLFGGGVSVNTNASSDQRLAIDGGGTLIVTNNGSGISGNERYQVRIGNGTLIIGAGTIIGRTNVGGASIGHALDLGVDLSNGIVNAASALRASNGVTVSNSIFASTTNSQARVIGASGANASVTYSGQIGLRDTALTIDSTNGQTVTVTGTVTNFSLGGTNYTGSLVKTNDGMAILSGANTYSGATTITNGTLRIANSSALGTTAAGTTVGSGATLELSNNINVAGEALTLHGAGVGGNGALRNVSGDNTNTGTITLGSSGRINADGGSLRLTGQIAGDAANSLTVGGAGNTTISGATTSARALTKDGGGTLEFTGVANTYGLVTVNGGTLRNTLDFNTAGLEGNSSGTLDIANTGISSQFYADFNAATRTYSGAITGPGNFVKRGTGTQVLDGTYTSTGGLYVDAGVATLGVNLSGVNYAATATHIGSVLSDRYGDSAELRVAGTEGGRAFTNALTVNQNTNSAVRLLTFENTSGTQTWSGGVAVAAVNNGGLVVSNISGGTAVVSGTVSGAGALTKTGAGIVVLSASNSHSGGTTLQSGTLRAGHDNSLGSGSLTLNGGTLASSSSAPRTLANITTIGGNVQFGDSTGTGNIALTGTVDLGSATRTLTVSNSKTRIDGVISGSGGLTKEGAGTLRLTAANSYSGTTTLTGGTLRIDNAGSLGSGHFVQTSGGTLLEVAVLSGTITNTMSIYNVSFTESVTLTGAKTLNNATITVETGDQVIEQGVLSGSGGITKEGGGDLTLNGSANNTYTGATVVNGGTLTLSNSSGNAINDSSGITVNSGASLVLGASNQIGNGIGLTLDGGTFLTGTGSAGYAETLGTLTLSSNSIIDLGSLAGGAGTRDIIFASSTAVTWTGSLTITNWQGVVDSSGTAGRLFFGVGGLTSAQLAQVSFSGFGSGAKLLGSGELVPIPEPRVYAAAVALLAVVGWRERRRILSLLGRKPAPRA